MRRGVSAILVCLVVVGSPTLAMAAIDRCLAPPPPVTESHADLFKADPVPERPLWCDGLHHDDPACRPDTPVPSPETSSMLLRLLRDPCLVTGLRLPAPAVTRLPVVIDDRSVEHPGFAPRLERPPRV